ncbi:predicted protein, partial [Nematostella vectensis]
VCEFLKNRGVASNIVEKFKNIKMDVLAVCNADDEMLRSMGLVKAGDRLNLKAFCESSNKPEKEGSKNKKRRLLHAFTFGKQKTSVTTQKQANIKKSKKIRLAGNIIGVMFNLNGKELPFNLSNYIESHKIKDVRIYLLTKTIDETSNEEESESEGPGGSLRSMLYSLQPGNKETDQSLVTMEVDADNGVVPFASPFFKLSLSVESSVKSEPLHRKEEEADNGFVSGLIGTSGQRERLRMEQLEQYHASLNEDRIKEQKKEEEKMDVLAVCNADDEMLRSMGLVKAGDRLNLKAFCESSNKPEKEGSKNKKRRLLHAFTFGKQKTSVTTQKQANIKKSKKIRLAGNIIGVMFNLNGKELPFNLSNYIESHKIKDVRIYLLTKTIDETSNEEESESEGPGGSLRSMLYSLQPGNEETDQSLVTMEVDADNGVVPFASPFFKRDGGADSGSLSVEYSVKSEPLHRKEEEADNGFVSGLIGTSGQRDRLRMEQLEQYHASLNEDRIKEQKKEEEKVRLRRKKKVRGSLDIQYDTFTLYNHCGTILTPNDKIINQSTLSMRETENNMAMSESDSEISFLGHGSSMAVFDDTLTNASDRMLKQVPMIASGTQELDNYYASICTPGPSGIGGSPDNEDEEEDPGTPPPVTYISPQRMDKDVSDILDELAKAIDLNHLTKLNIARKFLWEGAKRALSRKTFSPTHKISVKFTDDFGTSEGAVDWGGPMREFFSLIMQFLEDSHLFCGKENRKFVSFNSTAVCNSEVKPGTCTAPQLQSTLVVTLYMVPGVESKSLISQNCVESTGSILLAYFYEYSEGKTQRPSCFRKFGE